MTSESNEWVVNEAKVGGGIPDGSYIAEYSGTTEFTHEKIDGPKWKWIFEVKTGTLSGRQTDALTAKEINPNTHAGRLIKGLLGRELVVRENVKAAIESCKGKRYLIVVGPGNKGGKSAVQHVARPPVM